MTAGITEAMGYLVEKLSGAGLAATHTIGGVVIPGVWVHATGYEPQTLGGGARITAAVDLIAPDHDELTALVALDAMLANALQVVTPSGVVETDNALEIGSGTYPSFRIPITLEYTKEN